MLWTIARGGNWSKYLSGLNFIIYWRRQYGDELKANSPTAFGFLNLTALFQSIVHMFAALLCQRKWKKTKTSGRIVLRNTYSEGVISYFVVVKHTHPVTLLCRDCKCCVHHHQRMFSTVESELKQTSYMWGGISSLLTPESECRKLRKTHELLCRFPL